MSAKKCSKCGKESEWELHIQPMANRLIRVVYSACDRCINKIEDFIKQIEMNLEGEKNGTRD